MQRTKHGSDGASPLISVFSGRLWSRRLKPYCQVLLPVAMSLLAAGCATVRIVEPRAEASCAKTGAGTLIVRVVDNSGLSLPGVAVSLSKGSSRGVQRLTSDSEGVIVVRDLSPQGTCDLRAEHPGLETTIARHVSCAAGCETRLELVMLVDMRHAVTITEQLPEGCCLNNAPENNENPREIGGRLAEDLSPLVMNAEAKSSCNARSHSASGPGRTSVLARAAWATVFVVYHRDDQTRARVVAQGSSRARAALGQD